MKPPLRGKADVEACSGARRGVIDALATDHAPHAGSEKMQEFERCPFGITGLETAIAETPFVIGIFNVLSRRLMHTLVRQTPN
jgi:dihydroorotase-like cyclic amidohydrolase